MFKKGIILSFCVAVAGCSSAAVNAWKASSVKKAMGTSDPSFVLGHDEIGVYTGIYGSRLREDYASEICEEYNSDPQLNKLYSEGLIESVPLCVADSTSQDILVEVGTTKEKCFLACTDRYIRYKNQEESILAYSVVKNISYQEAVEYSAGHIKNMIIVANIQKNKDNPEWQARLKSVCKKEKGLKAFCG